MTQFNSQAINILLVDDNKGDVGLTREALLEGKLNNTLYVCYDGVEAMEFLHKTGDKYSDVPTPDIILLDLNMPRKSGIEVLADIQQYDHLKTIPVIVLTTSNADIDIMSSYKTNANCYITKPVDFDHFITVIQSIENFWLSIVKLPTNR